MTKRDRYAADDDKTRCGHPNQKPVIVRDADAKFGKRLIVRCGDDKKTGCGSEWSNT